VDCPKCGHAQAGEKECERCGVIFARLPKKEEPPVAPVQPGQAEMEPPVATAKTSSGLAGWLVAMIVGLLAGWYMFGQHQQPAVDGGQPAAVSSLEGEQEGRGAEPSEPQYGEADQPQTAEGLAGKLAAAFPAGSPVEQARNATVFIKTPWGSGSGFFVTSNGYIVTNRHVVEVDPKTVQAGKQKLDELVAQLDRERRNIERWEEQLKRVTDQQVRKDAEEELRQRRENLAKYTALHKEAVEQNQKMSRGASPSDTKVFLIDGSELSVQTIKMSDNTDLALLSVDCYNAPFLRPMKDNRHLGQGQKVFSIGSPMGLRYTVTSGIISGYREHKGRKFIQTDAPINPGNSGGPLIDEQGGLIGINTMVLRDAQGIGFAVPFQEVKTEFGQYLGGM
jgi:S1-C subfamily serine protease